MACLLSMLFCELQYTLSEDLTVTHTGAQSRTSGNNDDGFDGIFHGYDPPSVSDIK